MIECLAGYIHISEMNILFQNHLIFQILIQKL